MTTFGAGAGQEPEPKARFRKVQGPLWPGLSRPPRWPSSPCPPTAGYCGGWMLR